MALLSFFPYFSCSFKSTARINIIDNIVPSIKWAYIGIFKVIEHMIYAKIAITKNIISYFSILSHHNLFSFNIAKVLDLIYYVKDYIHSN